jgi:hypothetical protein
MTFLYKVGAMTARYPVAMEWAINLAILISMKVR